MSHNKFQIFDFVIDKLEGRIYSEDPNPTYCGVEQKEYDQFRINQGLLVRNIRLISDIEVKIIYDRNYWVTGRCDGMPWPLNAVMLQFILSLTSVAINSMQAIVGVRLSGFMDRYTMNEIEKHNPIELAQKLLDAQREHYKQHNKKYLKGLLARCDKVARFCSLA